MNIEEILFDLEIVARKHTIEVREDIGKIETMPASVVDELRLNNCSAKLLLDYITNLEEIRKEHNIMKQFIYENGLWERFLNDDRFLEHLRSDNSEQ